MKRPARLQAAPHWLSAFAGKNVVKAYARWFGVDLGCALKELRTLGVQLDRDYVDRLVTTLQNRSTPRRASPPAADAALEGDGTEWDDAFAYIAGVTSGGAPFGVTREELAHVGPRTSS